MRWRDRLWLHHHRIPEPLWHQCAQGLNALAHLDEVQRAHLRALASLFLHHKAINGVQGMVVDETQAVTIATLACLPVLELGGLDWYDDWHEVVVYPEAFIARHEEMDAAGVVHEHHHALSGEAWNRGPLILAWADLVHRRRGSNVVIHECAHKLDMRNGAANGFPPLHPGMSREAWTQAFSAAFAHLRQRLAHHHHTPIDPYGAESPAEFFAVLSEAFFEDPAVLVHACPEVYAQLRLFYRQDPFGGRETGAPGSSRS